MKTKNVILALILLVVSITSVSAQTKQKRSKEEILSSLITRKTEYLKENIPLNGDNFNKFVELYSELETKKFNISSSTKEEIRSTVKDAKAKGVKLTDKEFERLAEKQATISYRLAEVDRDYFYKFKEVLSSKELYRLYKCEKRFARYMIEKKQCKANGTKPQNCPYANK